MDSGFQVLDSGFINVSGPWIPDSLSSILDSKAQDSKFYKQYFQDFGGNTYFLLASIEHLCNFFITARPAYLIVHICT